MKTWFVRTLFVVTALSVTQTAFAARGNKSRVWMGSALDSTVTGTTVPALSAYFLFNDRAGLQTYLTIPSIRPEFLIGGGLNVKVAVSGDAYKGFHMGGGVGLGAVNAGARSFYININILAGVHFEIVDDVLVSLDSGASFNIQTEGPVFNMLIGGNSGLLGASVLIAL